MATTIKVTQQKKRKSALHNEIIKKHDTPGRNPKKAIDGMYGLWEGQDLSIEKFVQQNGVESGNCSC